MSTQVHNDVVYISVERLATSLKPGDTINFHSDQFDQVVSVEPPDFAKYPTCTIQRVNTLRGGKPSFFFCGLESVQHVLVVSK